MPSLRRVGEVLVRLILCCVCKPYVKEPNEEWESWPIDFEATEKKFSQPSSEDGEGSNGGGGGGRGDDGIDGHQRKARGRPRQRIFEDHSCSPSSVVVTRLIYPQSPNTRKSRQKNVSWITGRVALKDGNSIKKRAREVRMAEIANPIGKKPVDPDLLESLRVQSLLLRRRCQRSGISCGSLRARLQRIRTSLLRAAP